MNLTYIGSPDILHINVIHLIDIQETGIQLVLWVIKWKLCEVYTWENLVKNPKEYWLEVTSEVH